MSPLTDEPHEGRLHGLWDVHPEGAERLRKHLRRPLKHRLHVRSDRAPAAKRVVEILPDKSVGYLFYVHNLAIFQTALN